MATLNIEYFYFFKDAAEQESITKAAQSYHISQQGMSRAISQLEKSYGVVLFERKGNAIALTEAGQAFLEESEKVIQAHNHLNSEMACFSNRKIKEAEETVRVLVTLNVAFNIWPSFQRQIKQRCSRINLSVHEMWQKDIIQELCLSSQGDSFALITLPSTFKDVFEIPSLEFVPLLDIELMACVAKKSPYAKRSLISVADLHNARLALLDDPGLMEMLKVIMGVDQLDERRFLQTNNPSLIEEEILENNAIAFGNSFTKQYGSSNRFEVLPLEKTFATPMYLVRNKIVDQTDSAKYVSLKIEQLIEDLYRDVSFARE